MVIVALKLVTGEEIIGEHLNPDSEKGTSFRLKNPVGISYVRTQEGQSIGFSPFPLHADQIDGAVIDISSDHVVYSYEPAEDYRKNYDQIFGSGIVLPPEKKLITG